MPCLSQIGREVRDALGVVPHAVAVDEPGAGLLGDAQHAPVDVGWHAGEHRRRRLAEALRPLRAHEVVVAADAAGGHDDGRSLEAELADDVTVARCSAVGGIRSQDGAVHSDDGAVLDDEPVDAMTVTDADEPGGLTGLHAVGERRHDAGAGAPGDVEAGDRVAGTDGAVAAALGPADDGEPAHAHLVQPGALLAGGEVEVGLGPAAAPLVLFAVEAGRAEPVLGGEVAGVLDAHAALFGGVDQEQAAERPPGLAAERGGGLLLDEDHPLAGEHELGGGGQTGEAGSDHDGVSGFSHVAPSSQGGAGVVLQGVLGGGAAWTRGLSRRRC